MTVTATAKRRRRQAVMGFRQIARIGRGNNNRPFFSKHSEEILQRREESYRTRQRTLQQRVKKK